MEIRRITERSTDVFEHSLIATIGSFDGIHIGHKKLFQSLVDKKKEYNNLYKTAVFTFELHPDYYLKKRNNVGLIESDKDKFQCFKDYEIDYVFQLSNSVLSLSYEEFHEFILDKYNTKIIVVGDDFKYGANASGNVDTLKKKYEVVSLLITNNSGEKLSSNMIRNYLEKGEVGKIKSVLGHNYFVEGVVAKGAGLGRKLGFPTANIEVDEKCYLMLEGVYETKVYINKKEYFGITNVGKNPTVNTQVKPRIETYILGFNGDLYGKTIKVEFLEFIRGEQKFSSVDELKQTIMNNVKDLKKRL